MTSQPDQVKNQAASDQTAPTSSREGSQPQAGQGRGSGRRTFLAGLAGAGIGAAATLGSQQLAQGLAAPETEPEPPLAQAKIPFYGQRQAGIDTPPPAYGVFIALTLNQDLEAEGLKRLLTLLTRDAARLTQGQPSITDQEPELAPVPAQLTVTLGFGEKIFDLTDPAKKPSWLKPLPAFPQIDQLEDRWSGGDLLVQLCCQDRFTLAHAQRVLLKTARSFASVHWVQEGFRRAYGSEKTGQTMRNLFGQVDGTINPSTEDGSMESQVWGGHEKLTPWEEGGTSLVIRRIHMNLDTWDQADRPAREDAIGRKLSNGAPLTGQEERDPADLSATNELGFTVIAPYAHIRRASAQGPTEQILRRGYSYDLPVAAAGGFSNHGETSGGVSNSGLIFCSYQTDPVQQFLPIQERLAQLDMLNTWTVPIGSAVFAIPAGCQEGGFIGQSLFS